MPALAVWRCARSYWGLSHIVVGGMVRGHAACMPQPEGPYRGAGPIEAIVVPSKRKEDSTEASLLWVLEAAKGVEGS